MRKLLLLLALFCSTALMAENGEEYVLSVTGNGRQMVQAEFADIRVGIELSGRNAQEVQNALATQQEPVLDILRSKGAQKLSTSGLSVYPEYSKGGSSVIIGYRGSTTLSFSSNVGEAGELIDAAIAAGANKVIGVTVRPSKEVIAGARAEALRNAAQTALSEARILLEELGLEEKGVYSVTVDPFNHYGRALSMHKGVGMEARAIEILPEEQEVSASIRILLEFEAN